MAEPVNRRSYKSPLRAERARRTRRRVIAAAVELFLARGYAGTTLVAVAAGAEVSVDTVFHLFGNKRGLLQAAMDTVIGGDDADVPLLERPDPQAMRAETDPRRQIALFARGMLGQLERIAPVDGMLRSAAAVDPDVAALREDLHLRQRRRAMTTVAGWIASSSPLRDGMPVEEAASILWTLTSPEVHHMLRVDSGWPPDRYERWLRRTLEDSLLP
ncbi:TetR/AcrR family transcriptional regulator [Blastococcus goldschmidtiae]|uniref:Helix-turn-helix domain-containing protein n=1 Tax=Blastococcus goldschmidtiae TaxID=3075546 RepID=A0ABU2KCN3_9ACTN|nr:helix-turn-helix domain-containing protein [Blastococcus sp. DSM 46792]MDT0277940.1 helix-turn-helix domain-containing protein [Blastococcus sp. DSM 46792]